MSKIIINANNIELLSTKEQSNNNGFSPNVPYQNAQSAVQADNRQYQQQQYQQSAPQQFQQPVQYQQKQNSYQQPVQQQLIDYQEDIPF